VSLLVEITGTALRNAGSEGWRDFWRAALRDPARNADL
jgi:hypothetical protein